MKKYRPEREVHGEGWAPSVGNRLGGFLHISVEDAEPLLTDDGGLGQLLDFLSGEIDGIDDDGNPLRVPHPFAHRL